jgi:hypothetical protein
MVRGGMTDSWDLIDGVLEQPYVMMLSDATYDWLEGAH